MFINTNVSAINAQRHLFNSNKALDKTLERLASGLKINSGADDASGLAIAEKMDAQNAGLAVAMQNAQDGQALYKIADGALQQTALMLSRMEELAVRATNGTLTDSDRTAITSEMGELRDQINQIASSTEYNTKKILNGSMQVETHLNMGTGSAGSMRVIDTPGGVKTGSYAFELTSVASAAFLDSAGAQTLTSSGLININGIDISLKEDETVAAVAAKINAVNDQTGVLAVVGGGEISLITGTLDSDAENIDSAVTDVIGYANLGEDQEITISGDNTVLANMGFIPANRTAEGVDAVGTMGLVTMKAINGTQLQDIQAGSGAYGTVIDTDLYNGGNGVYIQNDQAAGAAAAITHTSADGDDSRVVFDVTNRLRLQVGANTNQSIYNGIGNISTGQLGIGGASKYGSLDDVELDTTDNANISLKVIQRAIEDVSGMRSKIGATMNRLDYTVKTLGIQRENMLAAQSRIQDADISAEMTEFTKQQIMLQTGTAMLAQANARPQSVLSLLG